MAVVLLIRIQGRLNPLGMIGRVGILLALETDAHVLGIGDAMLTDNGCIGTDTLEITTVDLYAGFISKHLHKDAGLRTVETGTDYRIVALTVLLGVQAEVVIITCCILDLVKVGLDTVTDSMRSTEIHRGSLYGLDLTCGNVEFVARGEIVGIHIEYLVIAGLSEVATQIVVVVVRLVDDGRTIALSLPGHVEDVVGSDLVGSDSHHFARESVLTIVSDDGQF